MAAAPDTAAMRKIKHSTLTTMNKMRKKPFVRTEDTHIKSTKMISRTMVVIQRPGTARHPICCGCVRQYPQDPVFKVPSALMLAGLFPLAGITFC